MGSRASVVFCKFCCMALMMLGSVAVQSQSSVGYLESQSQGMDPVFNHSSNHSPYGLEYASDGMAPLFQSLETMMTDLSVLLDQIESWVAALGGDAGAMKVAIDRVMGELLSWMQALFQQLQDDFLPSMTT